MTDDSTIVNGLTLTDRLIFGDVVVSNSNSRDVIIFPGEFNTINKNTNDNDDDEYNDIDLSGSFAPSRVETTLPPPATTTFPVVHNLNALCTSHAQMRLLIQLNANATSGTYTFPNGTQITYARCEVILIKHPD